MHLKIYVVGDDEGYDEGGGGGGSGGGGGGGGGVNISQGNLDTYM